MNKHTTRRARRATYWRRTWRNKLCALALIGIGTVPVFMEHDGTFLIVAMMFGVPMFFARKNWIL